jgi:hypothetical protein
MGPMRKMWLMAAALLLSVTAAAPAQFTVNGARIVNGTNTNAARTAVPTVGLAQMIPRLNGAQMIGNPLGNGQRTLNFSRMIPDFSWMRTKLFPIATPTSQYPANAFGQSQLRSR